MGWETLYMPDFFITALRWPVNVFLSSPLQIKVPALIEIVNLSERASICSDSIWYIHLEGLD